VVIKEFEYKKDEEKKKYNILILDKNEKYISGINLDYLSENDKNAILDIQKKYEEELKPFMKSYRKFLIENIITEEKNA